MTSAGVSAEHRMSWPRRLAARLRRTWSPPTIVLVYHRVLPSIGRDPLSLVVSEARFAAQMEWLAKHSSAISEDQLVAEVQRDRQLRYDDARPRVLVTFDDGYVDNHRYALPILKRYGIPAVVFATSGAIDTDVHFWWDRLVRILDAAGASDNVILREHARLKALEARHRDAELDRMFDRAELDLFADEDDRPMRWNELRAWLAADCAVGGHTRTHPVLSALGDASIRDEIDGCKADLEARLGGPIRLFAYPYGSSDAFDARCEAAVREAGFACGLANREGQVRWARRPTALPRCLVRDWTIDVFAAQMRRWCGAGAGS